MEILFVDDEESIRDLFVEFHKDKHKIHLAGDGSEALQKILENHYDLIISDISLPKMNGKELIETARVKGRLVPFIVITGDSDIQIAIQMFRLGAVDFFLKPFRMDVLRARIEKIQLFPATNFANEGIQLKNLDVTLNIEPKILELTEIVQSVLSLIKNIKNCKPDDLFAIRVVLFELISNSIEHGIAGITYEEKRRILEAEGDYFQHVDQICSKVEGEILLQIQADATKIQCTLTDSGKGFQPEAIPDPIKNPNLNLVSGRGIFLSKMNIPEIHYSEKGNRVSFERVWSQNHR